MMIIINVHLRVHILINAAINWWIVQNILNYKGNIDKKKFKTEIITPSFFVSFWNQLSALFFNRVICIFLFVIKQFIYDNPSGKFFTHSLWRSRVKLILYPGFSNTHSETFRTYTFLVMVFIVGKIVFKVKFLKVN